ncbi:MAG: hypothetical protein ACTSPY_15745 [Candidatus Helarchaeota archaeon]
MSEIDIELEELQNSINNNKDKLIKLEDQLIQKEESNENLIKNLMIQLDEKGAIIEELKLKIEGLKVEVNEKNNELNNKINELNDKINIIKNLEDEKNKYISEIDNLKKNITQLNEKYQQQIHDLEEKVVHFENLLKEKEDEFEKQKDELKTQIKDEREKLKSEFEKEKAEIKADFEKKLEKAKEIQEINDKIKVLIGEKQFIPQINNMLKNVKVRILLIIPKLEYISKIDLSALEKNVVINLSTNINMNNSNHKSIIQDLRKNYNITIRNYESEDIWGIKKDGDSLLISSKLESGDFFGFYTTDINIVNLFSGIISDATLRAKKVGK